MIHHYLSLSPSEVPGAVDHSIFETRRGEPAHPADVLRTELRHVNAHLGAVRPRSNGCRKREMDEIVRFPQVYSMEPGRAQVAVHEVHASGSLMELMMSREQCEVTLVGRSVCPDISPIEDSTGDWNKRTGGDESLRCMRSAEALNELRCEPRARVWKREVGHGGQSCPSTPERPPMDERMGRTRRRESCGGEVPDRMRTFITQANIWTAPNVRPRAKRTPSCERSTLGLDSPSAHPGSPSGTPQGRLREPPLTLPRWAR